ncbi:MAG: PAS domain S-box protein [Candidatus Thorarchaeota archaeon]|nr:PAS domain S-box protein [Candidatus Thorarchaeota archaeon]
MKDGLKEISVSEAEYKSLLAEVEKWRTVEKLTDIIWSVDMNLNFTYISPSVKKLLGYTQKEMMGKSLFQLLTPESISLIKKTLAEGLVRDASDSNIEIPAPFDVEAKHRDGTAVWLELSRVFVKDEKDTPIGVLGVARDISESVRITRALKESEANYRALAEKSVLGITIAQANPIRIAYANETMENFTGYSREEITSWKGEETATLIYPEDRAIFFGAFKDRLENRSTQGSIEFRGVHKDGEIVWLEVHGTKIEYQSEPAVLATFIDITDRRQAQREMEEQRNYAEFLIDLMSHDLNNIHQGMMTALELLSTLNDLPPESRTFLENSLSQLERAGGLISKVKTLSEVKSKKIKPQRIDIHEPISKALDSIRKTFPQREINVDFNIKPETHIVSGCEFLLDVFYNLLHNAVKADINEPVILEINAEPSTDGASLQVTVVDRGPGIPDSKKSSILSRLGDERTARSGIGLTLVQQIMDRCKGKIWIEDRVKGDHSKGAKFVMLLQLFQD